MSLVSNGGRRRLESAALFPNILRDLFRSYEKTEQRLFKDAQPFSGPQVTRIYRLFSKESVREGDRRKAGETRAGFRSAKGVGEEGQVYSQG